MTTQHTPGPWKSTASIPEDGFECFWIESNDEFRNAIADVRGPQNSENTSNARLIAAAPELLNALRSAVSRQAYRPGHGPDWWNEANSAIAKATGSAA